MEFKIKEIIDQIKELNDSDFEAVNKEIEKQDLDPETKTLANSNRRVMALFTQLFWQIRQEKNRFLK
jgi:division protein CdvB (Snf7/Vps24/ESCRT-III family)